MREYLLFVDTETSGIPQDWNKPYSSRDNWPHIAQLAWVVYTRDGQEVKAENHYILSSDYDMSPASATIHGITPEFLREHGKPRHEVMRRLYDDLLQYQPLVVAHFMQLDYHMMGVGFYRAGLDNPVSELPTFCTMLTSARFLQYSTQPKRGLRLNELHQRLFGEPMAREHDALTDAYATARCFFALWQRGDINEQIIMAQRPLGEPGKTVSRRWRPSLTHFIVVLALAALVALLLFF
ncbi:3'-5' exonuclease [Hymenobacter sp. BT188]|uniref:3'-5' exonuclease n=1 Tax=Hymenobacter sp. BT188 TaxID=2763504 RepID=UPI0016516FF0|nr:3'-5' exonuclease [Hymenobacter sp. BT188]MBC6607633.1 3'-5' exonuclease [Hymenobacter sp. BT188]